MNFLPLLGKQLKDDDMFDVLTDNNGGDIEVVYDFDRLHENSPDKYWATSKTDGFVFMFNADQILEVIFLYAMPIEEFTPVAQEDCDVPFFLTIKKVKAYGAEMKLPTTNGEPVDFLGVWREWVRLEFEKYFVHYEFRGDSLAQVTVTLKKAG